MITPNHFSSIQPAAADLQITARVRRDTGGTDDTLAASGVANDLEEISSFDDGLYRVKPQSLIHDFIVKNIVPLPTFENLRQQVDAQTWQAVKDHPSAALGALLETPLARDLGEKLKDRFGGSMSLSAQDWAIAGVFSLLDKGSSPEASGTSRPDSHFAGIKLEPLDFNIQSDVVRNLTNGLENSTGVAPDLAPAAAYLALWKTRPEYNVRGVPADFVFNTAEGKDFAAQVRKMEAQSPTSGIAADYQEIQRIIHPELAATYPVVI
ncbi:MAG: hypothetical protein ACRC1I_03730 [Pseudomonas proteolytica]|uniref:hypothetical protein n=1 Tax=Pseudomonas proteolytica TaxID=219574 RepID=UPI003F3E03D3